MGLVSDCVFEVAPMILRLVRSLAYGLLFVPATASLVYAAPLVVETPSLSPEEQRKQFHLPEGFEIQLVVSEPDIGQPMNLNFDAAGRLWITSSIEYPYPVEGEGVEPREQQFAGLGKAPARDRLTVVEGIGPDGKPRKITTFAGGLNIPIGQIPLSTSKAIVFSIPEIALWEDTDGDGVGDKRTPLYGRFGNLDTHGMASSFTRGLDGWIYACHGFRNTSKVKGSDGQEFTMNSGNTFRFRPDGSHIEQWTWGQVNPFGMGFDDRGNLYNSDCHSKPITMLLRGAYYDSFGKPHDGLGFGPDMIDHNHGSTGICGVAFYQADQFPADYQQNVFICNPVNGQVHRDKLVWTEASPKVNSQPEFVTSDDGWFRPVDVKLGPDGALYIADFHNSIIGHYEVPLNHPKRDRETGRVWRVVYTGKEAKAPQWPAIATAKLDELVNLLASPNFTVRVQATHELVDRFPKEAAGALDARLAGQTEEPLRAHAVWVFARTGALTPERTGKLAADPAPLVRTHLVKALAEQPQWTDAIRETVVRGLQDADPFVRMASAEALGRHPDPATVAPLFELLGKTDRGDLHLIHTIRIALRNHLNEGTIVGGEALKAASETHPDAVLDILLATTSPSSADFLVDVLLARWDSPRRAEALQRIARYADKARVEGLIATLQGKHLELLPLSGTIQALRTGLQQRGGNATEWLRGWALDTARELLSRPVEAGLVWTAAPVDGQPFPDNPFVTQVRGAADGRQDGVFFNSILKGEQRTGVLRSSAFPCPAAFSFWMAGHNGLPSTPEKPKNIVILRDQASGAILRQQTPPRNDLAQETVWDLKDHVGKSVFLEIFDRDTRDAYAWLAVGRFSVADLNPRDAVSPVEFAARLAAMFRLTELEPQLVGLVGNPEAPVPQRAQAGEALLALAPDTRLAALLAVARDPALSSAVREQCLGCLTSRTDAQTVALLGDVLKTAPLAQQRSAAETLASDPRGGEALLSLIEQGRLSPTLLRHPALVEKLKRVGIAGIDEKLTSLTKNLPPENEALAALITERRQQRQQTPGTAELGRAVFAKHCAACHQIGDQGNRIGPQLDGVGIRGVDRLLEDILDPNRNVDAAFRTSTLVLTDGRVLTGLKRREEGDVLVFADVKGQEFKVQKSEIDEQASSPLSLMPANVAEIVPAGDFHDLIAFLLTQRTGEGR